MRRASAREVQRERVAGRRPVPRAGRLAEPARRGVLGRRRTAGRRGRRPAPGRRASHQLTRSKWCEALCTSRPPEFAFSPVPAAEVVGAVHGVQRPLEVHRRDRRRSRRTAMTSRSAELRGAVAVVERHDDVATGLRDRARRSRRQLSASIVSGFSTTTSAPARSARATSSAWVVRGRHDDDVDPLRRRSSSRARRPRSGQAAEPAPPTTSRRTSRARPGLASHQATSSATSGTCSAPSCVPDMARMYMPARLPVPMSPYRSRCAIACSTRGRRARDIRSPGVPRHRAR